MENNANFETWRAVIAEVLSSVAKDEGMRSLYQAVAWCGHVCRWIEAETWLWINTYTYHF